MSIASEIFSAIFVDMGTRRCRLPTPTAILKLRGSRLAAARSQNELVGTTGNPMPMASADCDEATRKIFAQLLSQLNELRVLTTQDYAALSLLASTLALGEHAAAMAAARDAAMDAARDAARGAAWTTTWDAAWYAEREWQTKRLMEYLYPEDA